MQRHVPALDALGDERPQRRQVRGEPDRRHDRGQLARARDAEHAERQPHARVRVHDGAHRRDGHRQLDRADQVFLVDRPGGERAVGAAPARVGVRARLDRAPVVAGGDGERVDAVHDALVVRGGAVRVGGGQVIGVHHPLGHLGPRHAVARQRLQRHPHRRARQPPVGQVREDAEARRAAPDLRDRRREALDQRDAG